MYLKRGGKLGHTQTEIAQAHHFQALTKARSQLSQKCQTIQLSVLVWSKLNF
jgi:hypothetical protein